MDFFDYLLSFMPHRWLNRKKKGVQRLFGGLAKVLEWVDGYRQVVVRNSSTRTAVEIIPELESEYGLPVNPANLNIEARRQRIVAKKRERGGVVQENDVASLIAAYGLEATLERPENCVLMINMPSGIKPDGLFENIRDLLEHNVRAHVRYAMNYNIDMPKDIYIGTSVSTKKLYHIEMGWPITNPTLNHDTAVGIVCSHKKTRRIEVTY